MSDLQVKLDWFSFTFPITHLGDKDEQWTVSHILEMFERHIGRGRDSIGSGGLWEFVENAGFYSHAIAHPLSHLRINWRAGNPHAQAVFSGQACDVVLASISPSEMASLSNGRCTRMDIACDIETNLTPADFIGAGYSERILSHSSMASPTGLTEYVGSRAGERMARIYRYHPPHPRAHLLRIEIELKGDAAKIACDELTRVSLNNLCVRANASFAWKHPIWDQGGIIVSKLPARKYDREGAETLKWLNEVVPSALIKAHNSGLLDFYEWLDTHFPVGRVK